MGSEAGAVVGEVGAVRVLSPPRMAAKAKSEESCMFGVENEGGFGG